MKTSWWHFICQEEFTKTKETVVSLLSEPYDVLSYREITTTFLPKILKISSSTKIQFSMVWLFLYLGTPLYNTNLETWDKGGFLYMYLIYIFVCRCIRIYIHMYMRVISVNCVVSGFHKWQKQKHENKI